MAEISRPWDGIVLGDSGPYSDDLWTDVWATLLGPAVATEGVFFEQLNELVLTGVATPVSIATGRALVDGSWYESDTAVTQAIGTPGVGDERIDLVVLRKDWALQTIRITTIAGAAAVPPAAPPLPVQNDGVTWDLPLWEVRINDAGVITIFRDRREFLGQYEPAGYSTPNDWYVEDEFDWSVQAIADGDHIKQWGVTIDAGAGNSITILDESGSVAGAIRLSHGAGTGDQVGIASGRFRPDQANARFLFRMKSPNTDGNLDKVVGLVDARNTLTPTEGVFWRADGAGNWFAVTRSGGGETATDSAQAQTDTYKRFDIQWHLNSSVTFLINGVVVATHTTNIPNDQDELLAIDTFDNGVAPVSQAYLDVDLMTGRGNR